MLSISEPLNVGQVTNYYKEQFSRGYYFKGEEAEIRGEWFGKGAERLGLKPGEAIDQDIFRNLAFGDSPAGEKLIQKSKKQGVKEHRAGWDFTISAPKSIAIVALAGGDERLIEAHREAAKETFSFIEEYAHIRAGSDRNQSRRTNNIVAALFEHYENRNQEEFLHTHGVVFNMSFDEQARDRKGNNSPGWRALQTYDMHQISPIATQFYRMGLAHRVRKLGYEIRIDEKGAPQIHCVPDDLIAARSSRRAEVVEVIEQMKLKYEAEGKEWSARTEAKVAEYAAKRTRKAKQHDVSPEELKKRWYKEITEVHNFDLASVVARSKSMSTDHSKVYELSDSVAIKGAVDLTIDHLTERSSHFQYEEFLEEALLHQEIFGKVSPKEIIQEFEARIQSGSLCRCELEDGKGRKQSFITTQELIVLEKEILQISHQGKDLFKLPWTEQTVPQFLSKADEKGRQLSPEQIEVATAILLNQDQFLSLHGKAGVGKSFTLRKIADFAELHGYSVSAFGPTITSTVSLQGEGLAARTLQSHLVRPELMSDSDRKALWIVDEAGMVGARDMKKLLDLAMSNSARVLLTGDLRQHSSVPAGAPYRQLIEEKVLQSYDLEKMVRQRTAPEEVRKAVEAFSEKKVNKAMSLLSRSGRVLEKPTIEQQTEAIAEIYTSLSGSTLVVVATNKERVETNYAIRDKLIEIGEVNQKKSVSTNIYANKNITKAYRQKAMHYETGNMIRFVSVHHPDLERGEWYRVKTRNIGQNLVTVETSSGTTITYNPHTYFGVEDIYRVERRQFAVGDKVQFRGTDRRLGVNSGEIGRVQDIIDGDKLLIKKIDGERVTIDSKNYFTIDYAYAVTGHAAQGLTVDNAIVLQTSNHREEVVNLASGYVGSSRVRDELYFVVDNLSDAKDAISRENKKRVALDIASKNEHLEKDGSQGFSKHI